MLDGLRVLDFTDHRGDVGPWLLGRLGADVVRIEGPEGSPSRQIPPLHDGQSLHFASYNDNKRSIVLDPTDPADRATLAQLVSVSDMVFDSGPPGALADYEMSEAELRSSNPSIIHVQVTAFGSDGPRAQDPATELTIASLGGPVRIQGISERAPLKISVPQVWRHAGAEAALASLVALARRATTGEAQFLDVSAQSAMTWTMLNSMEAHGIQGFDNERTGATLELAMPVPLRQPAADGYVVLIPRGPTLAALLPKMIEDGIVDAEWLDEDWQVWDQRIIDDEPTTFSFEDLVEVTARFCQQYTKQELLDLGMAVGVTMAPVNTVADLAAFEQLVDRKFWSQHPNIGTLMPGGFALVDEVRVDIGPDVPDLGQHTDEVRAQLAGMTAPSFLVAERPLPLAGVKVADFSWIGVGPITAKALADHGAEVIRVESINRIDGLRVQPPFKDAEFGINRSQFWGSFNTSKSSLAIDLKTEGGLRVARRLTEWADVVIDSFTPGTMSRMGLGPEQLRQANPDVITVTTSLLGSGGPYSHMAGYGYHAAAIAGFFGLVGWPDLPPDGPWLAYTDTIGPRFITPVILAALERKRRTGEGCHIEAAQLEIALQLLAPELLDYRLNNTVVSAQGNRDPHMAPQGLFPCAGDDCWVAISVRDDGDWRRLRLALDDPSWAKSAMLDSVSGRQTHHDAIDTGISAWTISRTEDEVEQILLAAGVPAAKVQRSSDLLADPQYTHRGFYRYLEHAEMGVIPYAGHQYRIAGYDHGPRTPAPLLGEHTFDILADFLGFTSEEIADIAATGALE